MSALGQKQTLCSAAIDRTYWGKVQKVSVDLVVLDREKLEPIFTSDVSLLAPAKE
jgi:hypothetical protein